jgi:hypothetical protein
MGHEAALKYNSEAGIDHHLAMTGAPPARSRLGADGRPHHHLRPDSARAGRSHPCKKVIRHSAKRLLGKGRLWSVSAARTAIENGTCATLQSDSGDHARFRGEGWIPVPLPPPTSPRRNFSVAFWRVEKRQYRRGFLTGAPDRVTRARDQFCLSPAPILQSSGLRENGTEF